MRLVLWFGHNFTVFVQKLDAGSQLSLIDDLHRDIRSAAAEVRGQHLPGFCLPKKVRIT